VAQQLDERTMVNGRGVDLVIGTGGAVSAAGAAPSERLSMLAVLVRRLPFSIGYFMVTMTLAMVLGSLWSTASTKPWYHAVAYGLPAFEEHRWHTLVLGTLFAEIPAYYIFVAGAFLLLTGFAEWHLGTRRTVVLTVVYQFAAILLTALVLVLFRDSNWEWAAARAPEFDTGFSAGMLAVFGVATAVMRPPWRLRLRIGIWAYVLFSLLFVGELSDAEHFIAVVLSLPFSSRLAGPHALKERALPSRYELRLLASVGVLLSATAQLIAEFLPNRITPFGATFDDAATWYILLPNLVVSLIIANGLRRGYRLAWVAALVQAAIPVGLSFAVVLTWGVLLFVPGSETFFDDVPQFTANAVFAVVFLAFLALANSAFAVPRRSSRRRAMGTSNPETAKELLRKWGGSTLSWMTTWADNRHMLSNDGQSYVAFRRQAGVAVALGDPVGPRDQVAETVGEFVRGCDRAGVVPFFFSCTEATRAVTDQLGWKSVQVAEDNILDLEGLEFTGKKWQDIRTALNRAAKEGVTFKMVTLPQEAWLQVQEVEDLCQEWLGLKGLPEMGFTLGGVAEALDSEVRVGLAIGSDGTLQGVTSWMPVYGGDGVVVGWTLDLMRRRENGFRPAIEFLIASACRHFKAEGASFVSLSGAPLAKSAGQKPASLVEKFLDTLGASLEPVYGFRSLHAFKSKFQPRLSPMYMAFRDEADLPRIGIAITRAYLPTAGIRDLIALARH
jgi:lysylphosphatidylglycerol synthetase-like protein (DUF2156 family)